MTEDDIERALRDLGASPVPSANSPSLPPGVLKDIVAIQMAASAKLAAEKRSLWDRVRELPLFIRVSPVLAAFLAVVLTVTIRRGPDSWLVLADSRSRAASSAQWPLSAFNGGIGVRPDFPSKTIVLHLEGGALLSGSLSVDPSLNEINRADRQFYRVSVVGSLPDGTVVSASGSLVVGNPLLLSNPSAAIVPSAMTDTTLALDVFSNGLNIGSIQRVKLP